jgi:hypothetical protein
VKVALDIKPINVDIKWEKSNSMHLAL